MDPPLFPATKNHRLFDNTKLYFLPFSFTFPFPYLPVSPFLYLLIILLGSGSAVSSASKRILAHAEVKNIFHNIKHRTLCVTENVKQGRF